MPRVTASARSRRRRLDVGVGPEAVHAHRREVRLADAGASGQEGAELLVIEPRRRARREQRALGDLAGEDGARLAVVAHHEHSLEAHRRDRGPRRPRRGSSRRPRWARRARAERGSRPRPWRPVLPPPPPRRRRGSRALAVVTTGGAAGPAAYAGHAARKTRRPGRRRRSGHRRLDRGARRSRAPSRGKASRPRRPPQRLARSRGPPRPAAPRPRACSRAQRGQRKHESPSSRQSGARSGDSASLAGTVLAGVTTDARARVGGLRTAAR